eukprot:TRINITY_DN9915_c0_g2_i2.p1 TRINITY_DN9915_c0_g2~~TRINITY_DN9915_c0_g2_i2.p1  ORF type:complete len:329 (+),score=69.77 TRINITY_DN9915_c0_g2_i2:51-989(+)
MGVKSEKGALLYGNAAVAQPGYDTGLRNATPLVEEMGRNSMQAIAESRKLIISEKVNRLDVAAAFISNCMCQENEYSIYNSHGGKVLMVKEKSSLCCRILCTPKHKLQLEWSDPETGDHIMTTDRPLRMNICPAVFDRCRQQAHLYNGPDTDGKMIGYSKQPKWGGGVVPTVEVFMNDGLENPFSVIEGPKCCFGGFTKLCCEQQFPVSVTAGKMANVAHIQREKPETTSQVIKDVMTDADLFSISFIDPSLSPQQKAVLLSSVLLLDYMFFETGKPWQFQPWRGKCSVVCAQCYLCGMLFPIQAGVNYMGS